MSRHMRREHFFGQINCEICPNLQFLWAETLFLHHLKEHSDQDFICPSCKTRKITTEQEFHDHCVKCKTLRLKNKQRDYIQMHTSICNVCGQKIRDSKMEEHMGIHTGAAARLHCEECGFNTHSKVSLLMHSRRHMRERGMTENGNGVPIVHYCPECNKEFARKTDMEKHVRVVHKGIKETCICSYCGKSFSNKETLNRHIGKWHNIQEKNICKVCGHVAGNQKDLRHHNRVHLPPAFICPECQKGFRQRGNLVEHMRQHTGEHPYKCYFCTGYSCKSSSVLLRHLASRHKITKEGMKRNKAAQEQAQSVN